MIRTCVQCGNDFTPSKHFRSLCSEPCKASRRLQNKTKPLQVLCCLECGKDFQQESSRQKICSDECRRVRSHNAVRKHIDNNREHVNAKAREAYWRDPKKANDRVKVRKTREQMDEANAKARGSWSTHGKVRRQMHYYGLTWDQATELLKVPTCEICGNGSAEDLHTDHDHSTNVVRGRLCQKCNRALGLLNDDTDRLQNAIVYLQQPSRYQDLQ